MDDELKTGMRTIGVDRFAFLFMLNGRVYQAYSYEGRHHPSGEIGWKIGSICEVSGDGISYLNTANDPRTNGKMIYDSPAQALATAGQVVMEREFAIPEERHDR